MASEINNLSSTNIQSIKQFSNSSSKKAVQSEPDKEKSKAMTYMIGATAVATIIAVGILSKNGKLGENVKNALWGTSKPNTVKPNVSSTINDILTPDQKAKSTLANYIKRL